jgi:hypothetical protein
MSKWSLVAGVAGSTVAVIAIAAAQDSVRLAVNVAETAEGATLSFRPESGTSPEPKATVAGGVLAVSFAAPVSMDTQSLVKGAPRLIASARQNSDGKTLRVSLRRSMQAAVTPDGAGYVVTLAPGAATGETLRPAIETARGPANASVSVGQREDYTRLTFAFVGATTVTVNNGEGLVSLGFNRAADIDLANLRISPPRLVKSVTKASAQGQRLRLNLAVDPGVKARHFIEGDRVVVDLYKAADAKPGDAGASVAEKGANPSSRPISGKVSLRVEDGAQKTTVYALGAGQAAAAAFRRDNAVWIVLDGNGEINFAGARRAGRRFGAMEVVRGRDVTALRLETTAEIQISARVQDGHWAFDLAPRYTRAEAAAIRRDVSASGRGKLVVDFNRDGVVRELRDPVEGSAFKVALTSGPARGVESQRAMMEAAIAPSAHGALIEMFTDEVEARFEDGDLVVSRAGGLIAAQDSDAAMSVAHDEAGATNPTADDYIKLRARRDELERRAAMEGVQEGARVQARLALAEFFIAHDLAPEALGALRLAAVNQPQLELDPAFRLMRATANAMMGRAREAKADLDMPALEADLEAALWRGYLAANMHQYPEAARNLAVGKGGLLGQPLVWQGRFSLAAGEAAFALNDLAAASAAAGQAMASNDAETRMNARILQARIAHARGDAKAALAVLDEAMKSPFEAPAVRATFFAIRLRKEIGELTPMAAADALEALRFRWRGDEIEIETLMELGVIYAEAKKWREGLTVMRQGSLRFVNQPLAREMRVSMGELFARLYLEGEADQLEPVQALGLFYDFRELTPIGPDGDRMVRGLAGRLAKLDLLEQAAQLLQHQVDERLEGVGRAQIAADLAGLYLSDAKPEKALAAIEISRQPNIPKDLLGERRILEAKALLDLGRSEHAIELLERDRSEAAQRVRAEAAWRERDWPRAAAELRQVLALRAKGAPIDEADRAAILRAAIAMTFADDRAGLVTLRKAWLPQMAATPEGDSFDVVTAGIDADGAQARELARAISRTDLLDRFLDGLRKSMPGAAVEASAPAPAAAG